MTAPTRRFPRWPACTASCEQTQLESVTLGLPVVLAVSDSHLETCNQSGRGDTRPRQGSFGKRRQIPGHTEKALGCTPSRLLKSDTLFKRCFPREMH